MPRTGRFSFAGRSGKAEWSFDGSSLCVLPEDGGPLTVEIKEIAGVSGDGYTVAIKLGGTAVSGAGEVAGPADELVLSMLGHDGPTLLGELRREWIKTRAGVLRLGGSGESWTVSGLVSGLDGGTAAAEDFNALLFEDVLVATREGQDLDPVFMALLDRVDFDEDTYSVRAHEWPRRPLIFSKLARQTDEFVRRLREGRQLLAKEAVSTLAATVPSIGAGPRASLASTWMPGRLLEISRMNALCLGFEQAFVSEWLPTLVRSEEGKHLLEWAGADSTWLGCSREGGESGMESGGGEGTLEDAEASDGEENAVENAGSESAASDKEERRSTEGEPGKEAVWMLAGRHGIWFLEALSVEGHATYCFAGGDEIPALASRLLCAPQFSKEALYLPVEELVGDRADLGIPARSVDFLVELRRCLRQRVIHRSVDGWKKEIDRLAGSDGLS